MNPLPEWDGTGYDGKEIAPGVFVVGDVHWNEEAQQWRCLVNWNGALALAAVRVHRQPLNGGVPVAEKDILQRLKNLAQVRRHFHDTLYADAAAEIDQLRGRVKDLELALQSYMDACAYAEKDCLMAAIGAAHKEALRLLPRRVHPSAGASGG